VASNITTISAVAVRATAALARSEIFRANQANALPITANTTADSAGITSIDAMATSRISSGIAAAACDVRLRPFQATATPRTTHKAGSKIKIASPYRHR